MVVPAGTSNSTMNLEPGEYTVLCLIPDANGVPHAALGMARNLIVFAPPFRMADAPESDLTIDLVDFGFNVPEGITAGTHTAKITNSGAQDHEMVAVQLPPDKSIQDFLAAFESGAELEGLPPGLSVGGIQPIAAGTEGYVDFDFTAGKYGLVCFVEDVSTGTPHFVLGMVTEFQVE